MSLSDLTIELGSGMNDTRHEAQLADGECALLRNWDIVGQEWQTRDAAVSVHATAANARLLTPFAFRTNNEDDYLLCAGTRKAVKKQSGSGFVDIPLDSVGPLLSDLDRPNWFFIVDGLVAYACRPGMKDTFNGGSVGRIYHITKDRVTRAGSHGPSAAPNCNAAAGGTAGMEAGIYQCGYTFVLDSGTTRECETEMSPIDTATIVAGEQITFAALEVGSHPRCNARRLYISVAGGETLFLALEVGNIPGTFIANVDVAVDDYGDEASIGLTTPPTNPEVIVVWDGRMWTHDGQTIYPSEPGKYENFDPLKSFKIYRPPNTPSHIRAMLPWDGTRMLIGMDYSTHYLVRDDNSLIGYRVEDVSPTIGCASRNAMCVLGSTAFWYSGKQVWATTGGEPVCISNAKVERTLALIPAGLRDTVVMAVDEKIGRVLMSFPTLTGNDAENDMVLSFTVGDGKWALLSYFDNDEGTTRYAPHWMGYIPGTDNFEGKFLAATFWNQWRVMSLESDEGEDQFATEQTAVTLMPIRYEFISKAIQAEGLALMVRRIRLALSDRTGGLDVGALPSATLWPSAINATITLRLDGNRETAPKEVTLSKEWTVINIDNTADPARTVSVHVVISSRRKMTCYGLVLETALLKRRTGTAA